MGPRGSISAPSEKMSRLILSVGVFCICVCICSTCVLGLQKSEEGIEPLQLEEQVL